MRWLTKNKGFTLLEILLVLTIISVIILMVLNYTTQRATEMRQERMVLQAQHLLNAAATFYTSEGKWPATLTELVTKGYLHEAKNNPWGQAFQSINIYETGFTVNGPKWGFRSSIPQKLDRELVAGRLPMSYLVTDDTNLYAEITVPGQNLNNARSVNFVGLYKNGACAPAPVCPLGMTPQIFVVPVSVSGVNDPDPSKTVYPISSFTAYAYGKVGSLNTPVKGGVKVASCIEPTKETSAINCTAKDATGIDAETSYWRVCLQVVTEKGDVRGNDSQITDPSYNEKWGSKVTVMALTRCSPTNEPSGSPFSVYTK